MSITELKPPEPPITVRGDQVIATGWHCREPGLVAQQGNWLGPRTSLPARRTMPPRWVPERVGERSVAGATGPARDCGQAQPSGPEHRSVRRRRLLRPVAAG